jgi:hypothetical protein
MWNLVYVCIYHLVTKLLNSVYCILFPEERKENLIQSIVPTHNLTLPESSFISIVSKYIYVILIQSIFTELFFLPRHHQNRIILLTISVSSLNYLPSSRCFFLLPSLFVSIICSILKFLHNTRQYLQASFTVFQRPFNFLPLSFCFFKCPINFQSSPFAARDYFQHFR